MKSIIIVVCATLLLTVVLYGYGQSKLILNTKKFKEKVANLGGEAKLNFKSKNQDSCTLKVIINFKARKVKDANGILGGPDYFTDDNTPQSAKEDMLIKIAGSVWFDVLEMDMTYKRIIVIIEFEGAIRMERCYLIVSEEVMNFCSDFKETDISKVKK